MSKVCIKFVNVNSDRRLLPSTTIGKAFPELAPIARVKKICETVIFPIENEIVFLFELDSFMLEELTKYAQNLNLECYSVSYNNSPLAFKFLIVSRIKTFIETVKVFPLTKSGTLVENNIRPTAPANGEVPSNEYGQYQEEILGDTFEKILLKLE